MLSDDAPEMVAVAARRATGYPQVSTAVFDQSEILAEDGHFDAVISRHGLMFAEDPVGAVREATRVLRPGGGFAAMTWGPRSMNPWLGLVLDAVGEQFGVPFPPPNIRGPFSLDDAALLTSVLEEGGLDDVQVQAVETPMHAASVQAWWERVPQLAGPLATALAAMEPDVREQIAQRAMNAGAQASRRDGDQIVFSGSVLIASGRAPQHRRAACRDERNGRAPSVSGSPGGRWSATAWWSKAAPGDRRPRRERRVALALWASGLLQS